MKKIEGIQALRAFACISVVLTHMSFISSGSYGVDIFFVISGYLMMLSTEKGLEGYWRKKIFRIVPFYWLMTFATSIAVLMLPNLFHSYEFSMAYLAKSLFFFPYEHHGICQPILGLGYTLNYEMLFYLIFYIASRLAQKRKFQHRGWTCTLMLLGVVSLKAFRLPMPFQFWSNLRMLDFMLGIVVYYTFNFINMEKRLGEKSKAADLACGTAMCVTAIFLWGGQNGFHQRRRCFLFGDFLLQFCSCWHMRFLTERKSLLV